MGKALLLVTSSWNQIWSFSVTGRFWSAHLYFVQLFFCERCPSLLCGGAEGNLLSLNWTIKNKASVKNVLLQNTVEHPQCYSANKCWFPVVPFVGGVSPGKVCVKQNRCPFVRECSVVVWPVLTRAERGEKCSWVWWSCQSNNFLTF